MLRINTLAEYPPEAEADCRDAASEGALSILIVPIRGQASGLKTTRLIRRRHPTTRVVLMSIQEGAEVEARCRQASAHAYLSKADLCERFEAEVARLFPAVNREGTER